MTDDTQLVTLLRSALPPVVPTEPSRDLWPLVMHESHAGPKWSWLDLGLAAGVVVALWMRPELLAWLIYHL